ncbi:MAG: DUF1579 family protein [Chloroflexales bacterium]|nr:DUF1579 family protein [Chloroflexales bacterium]
MSAIESLRALVGAWTGTSRLIMPGEPTRDSQSNLSVGLAARDKFITITYTWNFDGEPQEGVLLLGQDQNSIDGVWIDSWHMGDKLMALRGQAETSGAIILRGSYKIEGYPDWGWRTDLEPADGTFRVVMYNVSPEGEEMLGVEATYTRL